MIPPPFGKFSKNSSSLEADPLPNSLFQPVRGASHILWCGGEDAERVPLHHGRAHGGGAARGVEGGEEEGGEGGE